jgi:hypothetical protein
MREGCGEPRYLELGAELEVMSGLKALTHKARGRIVECWKERSFGSLRSLRMTILVG